MVDWGFVTTTVPFWIAICNVEIAVTVTVCSDVAVLEIVLLRASDRPVPRGFKLVEDSEGRGVGGGVVITDCESVVMDPTALVSDDMPGTVTATLTPGRDTTVSPAVTATVKAVEVPVPSSTLIWTAFAVTVASGARGKR